MNAAAAQRRIASARLLRELPDMKADVQTGDLNLSQISLVAQSIRNKEKSGNFKMAADEKKSLLDLVKNQDTKQAEKLVAQRLSMEVKIPERVKVPAQVRRSVHQRDGVCQWVSDNGKKCQSHFQLQVDHKTSRRAGGSDELNNLQLLCSVHNQLKYRKEAGIRFV